MDLQFLKAGRDVLNDLNADDDGGIDKAVGIISRELSEAFSAENLSFLLASGCSSFSVKVDEEWQEFGIPTMAPLASEFLKNPSVSDCLSKEDAEFLQKELGIDHNSKEVRGNLERLLELLLSWEFVLQNSPINNTPSSDDIDDTEVSAEAQQVHDLIKKIHEFIWRKCTEGKFNDDDSTVLDIYRAFYRKLSLRDASLSKPWIFTTNYDLFSETAMDRMGIPYANGFSGTVERRFNPNSFRHSLSERTDLSDGAMNLVHPYYHLCKLHGSISWAEDNTGLYPIREYPESGRSNIGVPSSRMMIFPTPAKQKSSLGSPYSDLFREFQKQISQPQSVLVTIGYSFGDEHINSIIYQALSVANFRLIIFANTCDLNNVPEIKRLNDLNDPRVWIIGGNIDSGSGKAHYFDNVVERFMPTNPRDDVEKAVEKAITNLFNRNYGKD